jgi:hypothetical protein
VNLVATLWRLQSLDQEIDDKTKRARQVDDALAGDPVVAIARAAFDEEQKRLAALRAALHDRELEAKGLASKIKELNDRLYSGRVSNPKELDGLDKDLQMHKRQLGALDDKLLELMDAVDQAEARINDKTNALEQVEGKRASDLDRLAREREALAARLAQLRADRAQTRAALDQETLRTYDKLRETKAGRAAAQLRRDACGACGVSVPTGLANRVHTGDEMVLCPSCGRILAA